MFGAFVELGPGREGLVHISQLDLQTVTEVAAVVAVGNVMDVMVLDRCGGGEGRGWSGLGALGEGATVMCIGQRCSSSLMGGCVGAERVGRHGCRECGSQD